MATAKRSIPEGYHTVTPMLTYENCAAALDWYVKGLGAVDVHKYPGPDGKLIHAEFRIGDTKLMAMDAMMDAKGPKAFGGSPVALWVYVDDCDSLFKRAVNAGATSVRPVENQFWGDRCGTFKDPHGYAWTIATHKEDLTPQELDQRSADFFKNVAGRNH